MLWRYLHNMGKLQGLLEAISESTDTPAPPTKR